MGGSLAVTIRDPNGKWHKMERWTNPTHWVFTDQAFVDGDMTFIQQYLDAEPEGQDRLLAPSEYGIVYIDFIKKRFWSMNDYTSYNSISAIKIHRDGRETMGPMTDIDRAYYESLLPRIVGARSWDEATQSKITEPMTFATLDELVADASATWDDLCRDYVLDWAGAGWDQQEMSCAEPNFERFRAMVEEDHELTPEELERWSSFRSEEE